MAELKTVDPSRKAKRGSAPKSGTTYPYFDLNDSVEVARAVHDQGGGTCSRDHLAAALNYSTTRSGAFLSRIYAAKTFGLIELHGDTVSLTERAHRILHPVMDTDEIAGRAEAFLAVPLFAQAFEHFKGGTLPATVGMENLLKTRFEIVPDRIKPALRVMLDSAEQAGFFRASGDRTRMIMPNIGTPTTRPQNRQPGDTTEGQQEKQKTTTGGGDGSPPGVHPAIVAILRELPRPGTEWQTAKKDRFMTGFRGILDIVYPEPEGPS